MAAGYDLKEGKYDPSKKTVKSMKLALSSFLEKTSKKESTYKYVLFKSILDNLDNVSGKNYELSFDKLFVRFSEIYWILVFKHKLPQKIGTVHAPETMAEKIIHNLSDKYLINKNARFEDLSTELKLKLIDQMKKKCSRYVFGALYADTNYALYSFSIKKEWIRLNPAMFSYLRNHGNRLQEENYYSWSRFYSEVLIPGSKDTSYYQRLLRREFKDFSSVNLKLVKGRKNQKEKACKEIINLPTTPSKVVYNTDISNKARTFLKEYPNLGLYMAQIHENVGGDREELKYVLDNSFWCRKEGSRYFYTSISDEDIISESLFGKEDIKEDIIDGDNYLADEENLKLLDDPEQLIKKLRLGLKSSSSDNQDEALDAKKVDIETDHSIKANSQRNWDREEVVILVTEYFRTKNMSDKLKKKNIEQISDFLRRRERLRSGVEPDEIFRNIAGITMQTSRIRCLDPETKYNGMKGTKLQRQIVSEYLAHPRVLNREAKEVFEKYNK